VGDGDDGQRHDTDQEDEVGMIPSVIGNGFGYGSRPSDVVLRGLGAITVPASFFSPPTSPALPITVRRVPHPYGRLIVPDRVLPHVVDVYRNQDTRLDAGDRIPVDFRTITPIYRNLACWVVTTSAMQALEFQRLGLPIMSRVVFFKDPRVINGDYLLFERRRILVVEGFQDGYGVGLVWEVSVREIT
jgi:hypothetical protein